VDEKDDEMTHSRMVAGRRIVRNYGRNNNSPATGSLDFFVPGENTYGYNSRIHEPVNQWVHWRLFGAF